MKLCVSTIIPRKISPEETFDPISTVGTFVEQSQMLISNQALIYDLSVQIFFQDHMAH